MTLVGQSKWEQVTDCEKVLVIRCIRVINFERLSKPTTMDAPACLCVCVCAWFQFDRNWPMGFIMLQELNKIRFRLTMNKFIYFYCAHKISVWKRASRGSKKSIWKKKKDSLDLPNDSGLCNCHLQIFRHLTSHITSNNVLLSAFLFGTTKRLCCQKCTSVAITMDDDCDEWHQS